MRVNWQADDRGPVVSRLIGIVGLIASTRIINPCCNRKTSRSKSQPVCLATPTQSPAFGGDRRQNHCFDLTLAALKSAGGYAQTLDVSKFVGTWKLNIAKSKYSPGPPPKSTTLDDYSFEVVGKVDGKATATSRVVISREGKTLTQTTTGKNAQGQTVNNTIIYDKQ